MPGVNYYPTENDALNNTNALETNQSFTLHVVSSITQWRIASNSQGDSSQLVVYNTCDVLNSEGGPGGGEAIYYLYPNTSVPCFLEGTNILCQVDGVEKYIPIETMRKDTIVKTLNGFKKVVLIGKRPLYNPGNNERIKDRLYKYSNDIDLFITGCHSVLVDNLTDKQRKDTLAMLGDIYVTEGKYRLIACVDDRSEPWNSEGAYTIWHFALEHTDIKMNYGVYANGLLVESCSINYLKNKSNMTIV